MLLSANPARPGDTILAGVNLKMDPGWHTYWKNPGESGIATSIKWYLPPGITAGEIQWPLPEKLPPTDVTTYGYKDEVMLLVPLTLATNLAPGPLVLKADVSWLECMEQCVPGSASVEATLTVGDETKPSADIMIFESWKSKTPQDSDIMSNFIAQAHWTGPTNDNIRPLAMDFSVALRSGADFFPDPSDDFEVQAAVQTQVDKAGKIQLIKPVKKFSGDWPKEISGVLITGDSEPRTSFQTKIHIGEVKQSDQPPLTAATASTPDNISSTPSALPSQPLWKMLIYAFIGGLILNLMPCVLPVIALKILGFVNEAKSEPRHIRAMGLVYAIGVLVSFLALAAIVIGIKAAGHQAGWGMQFGNPIFLVCLTVLVTLVALNLFGVFEVTLGGRALDAAGSLASKHGAAGAFFNGVLATILATPCTAPFLSIALGFAFAQSAPFIVLIFLTVGLGLAAPYVVLSWNPAWLKFLPKPGAWMEKFKIAMGFPMLATTAWLFNLAAGSYGKKVLWLGLFLIIVAFAAWIFGEFFQRGRKRRGRALIRTLL